MQYPKKIKTPAAWYGHEMARNSHLWTYHLTSENIIELEKAAKSFEATKTPLGLISKTNFPLPNFVNFLTNMQNTLTNESGFQLIKGLPIKKYSPEIQSIIFCGIGSYLGSARSQNAAGHLLGHVRDIGADVTNQKTRIYQTNARQSFHTDSCDVVGLLCLKDAKKGGSSMLASSVTVYNEIAKTRPDLLTTLFEPVPYDRRGEFREDQQPFFTIPVYNWHQGFLTCIYHRTYIESAQNYKNAPKLTMKQREVLDLLDEYLNDEKIHLKMHLEPGDMQFVYNHNLLHDREGYIDWPDLKDRRHLLRLWLSLPNDRPLPSVFKKRYGEITIGNRGGITTEQTILQAPING